MTEDQYVKLHLMETIIAAAGEKFRMLQEMAKLQQQIIDLTPKKEEKPADA